MDSSPNRNGFAASRRGRTAAASAEGGAAEHAVAASAAPSGGEAMSIVDLAEALRRAIVTGALPPGARLTEAALVARFGASPAALADALASLEQRGLVVREPRRYWKLRAHDERSIRQIYALRGLLERQALAGLAEAEDVDIDRLVADLTAANAAMEKRRAAGDAEGYLKGNERFHAVILRHAPNEPLRLAIEQLNDMAAPLRMARLAANLAGSTAVEEHAAIIEMLGAAQIDAAVDAMHDHILGNADAAVAAAI